MKIHIETIPHSSQRYPTVGDWYYAEDGTLHIKVSQMSDERYVILVAIHELVEVVLCKHAHITAEMVDAFDMAFENERKAALAIGVTPAEYENIISKEPGDDPACPIKKQHSVATGVERIVAALLDVDWRTYEKEVERL